MPRPRKCRKIGFPPKKQYFSPKSCRQSELEEVVITFEELEALRLADLRQLQQEESAKKMEISRGTFQRILNSVRKKVSDALINGKAIRIEGGNYSRNICKLTCSKCNFVWQDTYENFLETTILCPECSSEDVECKNQNDFCRGQCRKYRLNGEI